MPERCSSDRRLPVSHDVRSQGFLAKSDGTFRDHPVWANVPVEHQSQAMEVTHPLRLSAIPYGEQEHLMPYNLLW